MHTSSLLLSTAYAPPIEYMVLLSMEEENHIFFEAHEHYVKQSYRNRCDIVTSTGRQSLTIPVELPSGHKTMIRDVRISDHSRWRHLHKHALTTAYGSSPYFEYYSDDIFPLYDGSRAYIYLWDFNMELFMTLCRLLSIPYSTIKSTQHFVSPELSISHDYRYHFHPKYTNQKIQMSSIPYYQPFAPRIGFISGLSIYDLLFNMGPEAQIILRDSASLIRKD